MAEKSMSISDNPTPTTKNSPQSKLNSTSNIIYGTNEEHPNALATLREWCKIRCNVQYRKVAHKRERQNNSTTDEFLLRCPFKHPSQK